ncbi:hypothetical protein ACRRTK_016639 [Alexandromys fortis]
MAGPLETDKIRQIRKATVFNFYLCSPLQLVAWRLGDRADHASRSLLLYLKLLRLKNVAFPYNMSPLPF